MLAGLWLVYMSFGLIVTSIAPLVAPIEADLGMSHAAMGSVMGAWQLVYIASAIPCGILLDRLGGPRAILIGIALVSLSIFWRGVAEDYWSLLLAVMLFGLGGPIISSGAPKMVTELFTGSQRGFAMGIYMTGPAMGGVISLALTHAWLMPLFDDNWRAVMMTWTTVGVVSGCVWLLVSYLFVEKPAAKAESVRQSQVSIMADLIREPTVQLVLLMSVGVFLYNHGLSNWLVELLRKSGLPAITAGYWATLPTIVGMLASLIIPRLATPERRFKILLGLCLLAAIASVLLQFAETLPLTVGLIAQGIARSTMMTVLILSLVELPSIGEARAGVATGMFFTAAEVGGVLGPLGMGVLYDVSGGFTYALTSLTFIAALMCIGTGYLARAARQGSR